MSALNSALNERRADQAVVTGDTWAAEQALAEEIIAHGLLHRHAQVKPKPRARRCHAVRGTTPARQQRLGPGNAEPPRP